VPHFTKSQRNLQTIISPVRILLHAAALDQTLPPLLPVNSAIRSIGD
jgi:hypothetical protein